MIHHGKLCWHGMSKQGNFIRLSPRRICLLLATALVVSILLIFLSLATSNSWSTARPPHPTLPSQTTVPLTAIIAATSHDEFPSSLEQLGLNPLLDTMVVYRADDPTAPFHPPVNKGREAISYLTYLIDHYDHLPSLMVFLHAHKQSWHQNTLLAKDTQQILSRLRRQYVITKGFANLWCEWGSSCPFYLATNPPNPRLKNFGAAWMEMLPEIKQPPFIASPAGAQFAVTASTVKANLRRDQLERMRNWIIQTPLSSMVAGTIFEYLWPYLFLGPDAESCPQEAACYCQMFGVCFDQSDGTSQTANDSLHAFYELIDRRDEQITRFLLLIEEYSGEIPPSHEAAFDEMQRIKVELHGVDSQLNATLDAAVNRGLEIYPLDFSPIPSIDIFSGLMSY